MTPAPRSSTLKSNGDRYPTSSTSSTLKSTEPEASKFKLTKMHTSKTLIFSTSHANATISVGHRNMTSNIFPTAVSNLSKTNTTILANSTCNSASFSHTPIAPSGFAAEISVGNNSNTCTDGTFVDASCFDELALADYLRHWWARNENTCISKNAQFAECFFALETKYSPSDCAQINNDAACMQPVWDDFKHTSNGIQNFYVAWNLWNTAGFFLDMWTAIGAAEASAQASLASIVNILDPPRDEHVALDYVLDALTFGFSLYAEGSLLIKALLRSAPQTGGLTGKLFPSGTVDGEYQDWSIVAANVGKCTDSFRASVTEGLPLIENNITAFISWSKTSGLSGHRPPLHGLAENMTQALNTYAISRILSTQGVVVSRAPDTDVHALQTNGSQLSWDTGCSNGYNRVGVCDTFFWDGVDTYGLTDPEHFTRSYHDELTSFFTPNNETPSLTTGKLLFSGAQSCYAATGKNGGADPMLDPTDASHILCLSNVQVCTWDRIGYGPFDSSCKNLPDKGAVLYAFGVSGCRGGIDSTTSIDVPRAYLGPGIYQNGNNVDEIQVDSFCDNVDFKRKKFRRQAGDP